MASSHSELKRSLSSVPATALRVSSREILNRLNQHLPLRSPKGHARDSRGLAELMGFQWHEVKPFEGSAAKILETWETRPGSTLDKLIGYLEDMDRYDVIQDLIPTLENDVAQNQETPVQVDEENDVAENQETPVQVNEGNDVAEYQETPIQVDEENDVAENEETPIQVDEVSTGLTSRALTRHDLLGKGCFQFDALLAHDDDDSFEAFEIAQHLESPSVGLNLLIRARDLLAGNFEFETLLELMMNRCRHIVMILTPNFVRNPTLEFQVNFAAKLGIKRNERILIPVIVKKCTLPPILEGMTPIDLTRKYSQRWLWENLVNSILPKGRKPFSLPPLEGGPLNIINTIPNSVPSVPEDID